MRACMLTTLHVSLLDLDDDGLQFDITFHKLPCAWTSLDAMDISGEMHLDVVSSQHMSYPCCAITCLHQAACTRSKSPE